MIYKKENDCYTMKIGTIKKTHIYISSRKKKFAEIDNCTQIKIFKAKLHIQIIHSRYILKIKSNGIFSK